MPALANIDIIARSLRKLNVNPEGVTPTAEQAAECLVELNTMLTKWEEDGIYLQWFAQTAAADPFPLPEYTQQGVIGMLAVRVAANFSVEVSAETAAYAADGMETIVRKAMNKALPRADLSYLPQGTGRRGRYDRTTGRFI